MKETECPMTCPKCGTEGTEKNANTEFIASDDDIIGVEYYCCRSCGFKWKESWKFLKWEEVK